MMHIHPSIHSSFVLSFTSSPFWDEKMSSFITRKPKIIPKATNLNYLSSEQLFSAIRLAAYNITKEFPFHTKKSKMYSNPFVVCPLLLSVSPFPYY